MKKPWQVKEKKDVKDFGGKPTPRSGGVWKFPGDSKNNVFLIDSKTTEKKSFSVTLKMWHKINREALLNRRIPLLSIQFLKDNTEVVVMGKSDLLTLLERV